MNQHHVNAQRGDRTARLLLFVLLAVRLGMVAAYPPLVEAKPDWRWSNNDGYDTIAINLVETGAYGLYPGSHTASRLPLYPALIAAVYALAGDTYPAWVMLIQVIISTATGYLVFRMTGGLLGRPAAIATLTLFIMHPQINNFVIRCATETLFVFLVTAFLHHTVLFVQAQRRADIMWAAAWLGLSLMTRQTLAPLALMMAGAALVWSLARRGQRARRFVNVIAGAAMVCVLTVPWIVRNYVRSGHAPVLQTWVGQPLFQGAYVSRRLHEFIDGTKTVAALDGEALAIIRMRTATHFREHPSHDLRPVAREVKADQFARGQARLESPDSPVALVKTTLRNLPIAPVLQMTRGSTAVMILWNGPLLLMSFAGLIWLILREKKRSLDTWPIIIVFAYLLVGHAMVWPQARYILPGLVPFSMFAGLSMSLLASRVWPTRTNVPIIGKLPGEKFQLLESVRRNGGSAGARE